MLAYKALLLLLPALASAAPLLTAVDTLQKRQRSEYGVASQQPNFSGDVTQCQGYAVEDGSVKETDTGGLTARLNLLSKCLAYGTDIDSLMLSVEYETEHRLHVHIYDTQLRQYQLGENVLPRPKRSLVGSDSAGKSDIKFEYENNPFAFWVIRKSDGQVLFDTRQEGMPTYNDAAEIQGKWVNHTVISANPLVFEDQYLQLSSKLPINANLYGLGEVVAGSGYKRNSSCTVQTMWARDAADPLDENIYGIHPIYLEARYDEAKDTVVSHGVFLRNSNGMDIVLRDGVIQYRVIGGTLDFYIFSGPSSYDVNEQYVQTVGLPIIPPEWSLGFHLLRWGLSSANETLAMTNRMREAGIPLETQWNDIDWMRSYREFQFNQNYGEADYKNLVNTLHERHQHYIPIVDGAIGHPLNDTDRLDIYDRGHELDVWMKNPDGTEFVGVVWPTFAVFPDWFHPKMYDVWEEAFYNFSQVVDFDGIWYDMNEPSSFINRSAIDKNTTLENTTVVPPDYSDIHLPKTWPEGYWPDESGISGNITVNGTLTYGANGTAPKNDALKKRNTVLAARDNNYAKIPYVDVPPYPIRNLAGPDLADHTVSPNATHYGGLEEYNVHNVWGTMGGETTFNALAKLKPGKRPFIVSRSTFSGAGRSVHHWLGDNFATFAYMKRSIQGILQFNLFGIPMVGPDVCGFNGNSDEELCNRWMQLGAFYPFFRNHNIKAAIDQAPYVWDSVREASIKAIAARYSLLPYWSTLFSKASQVGTPVVAPLFYEFPSSSYFDNDYQFLIGPSVIVTPVLQPNESTVTGQFPITNGVFWVDWWTHGKLNTSATGEATLDLPLGNIGVHVRSGSILLLYHEPAYTVKETKDGGYSVLVVLDGHGSAQGDAKVDDGESFPVVEQTCLSFTSSNSKTLTSKPEGNFYIPGNLKSATIVGVWNKPDVTVNGNKVDDSQVEYDETVGRVKITALNVDVNKEFEIKW
ncbi:uncharacterized protein L203_104108 [Cryptococcus depauperatus CBS 7841]|uniref:Uncharacterized protein n=1 Tax=Cryptococcus depauperatus CBS 7841 TaxID=1295531 RepID=A0A1E3IBF9_9TREE|nr:alpha-glucosidase [Cryptococcus depauperatus CBS 7841]